MKRLSRLLLLSGSIALPLSALADSPYSWLPHYDETSTIERRIDPPRGFVRVEAKPGSFAAWLRGLPLKPGRPPVHLYDGSPKGNQAAHHSVLDLDVGTSDLQQCADAVMRLRAEFLYSSGRQADVAFDFTSGDRCAWSRWSDGWRPSVKGNKVGWRKSQAPDPSYRAFRRYLNEVFRYAGSASLSRELKQVEDPAQVQAGDVYIRGGFPGHAVLVLDVAADAEGRRRFLLAQSYMPAQEMHVLRDPAREPLDPWYEPPAGPDLQTPEWTFRRDELRRFE